MQITFQATYKNRVKAMRAVQDLTGMGLKETVSTVNQSIVAPMSVCAVQPTKRLIEELRAYCDVFEIDGMPPMVCLSLKQLAIDYIHAGKYQLAKETIDTLAKDSLCEYELDE